MNLISLIATELYVELHSHNTLQLNTALCATAVLT